MIFLFQSNTSSSLRTFSHLLRRGDLPCTGGLGDPPSYGVSLGFWEGLVGSGGFGKFGGENSSLWQACFAAFRVDFLNVSLSQVML